MIINMIDLVSTLRGGDHCGWCGVRKETWYETFHYWLLNATFKLSPKLGHLVESNPRRAWFWRIGAWWHDHKHLPVQKHVDEYMEDE
jgi:hypothetical protein